MTVVTLRLIMTDPEPTHISPKFHSNIYFGKLTRNCDKSEWKALTNIANISGCESCCASKSIVILLLPFIMFNIPNLMRIRFTKKKECDQVLSEPFSINNGTIAQMIWVQCKIIMFFVCVCVCCCRSLSSSRSWSSSFYFERSSSFCFER